MAANFGARNVVDGCSPDFGSESIIFPFGAGCKRIIVDKRSDKPLGWGVRCGTNAASRTVRGPQDRSTLPQCLVPARFGPSKNPGSLVLAPGRCRSIRPLIFPIQSHDTWWQRQKMPLKEGFAT